MKYFYLSICILLSALVASCSAGKKSQTDAAHEKPATNESIIVPDTFVLPNVPDYLTHPEARAEYLVMHYWDRFDVKDSKLIGKPAITEQAFVDYINILSYVSKEKVNESLQYTLKKVEPNPEMYTHFASLFEKYFYEANSPFRNEEFYLPILQSLVKSDILSEENRSTYQFQLDMAMKNRVGDKAIDFDYTLPSGKTENLHSIKSEYLVLMFSNPGCHTCEAVTRELNELASLKKAFSMNTSTRTMITVITVFPDADLSGWRSHLNELPKNWIHSYDNGMQITKKRLYDIKAIPTLYLLDKNKNVLLKDTSPTEIDRFFSVQR